MQVKKKKRKGRDLLFRCELEQFVVNSGFFNYTAREMSHITDKNSFVGQSVCSPATVWIEFVQPANEFENGPKRPVTLSVVSSQLHVLLVQIEPFERRTYKSANNDKQVVCGTELPSYLSFIWPAFAFKWRSNSSCSLRRE